MSQSVNQSVKQCLAGSRRYSNIYEEGWGGGGGSERSQESRSRERRKGIVSGFHHLLCHLSLFTPPLTEADRGLRRGGVEVCGGGKVTWLSSPAGVALFHFWLHSHSHCTPAP